MKIINDVTYVTSLSIGDFVKKNLNGKKFKKLIININQRYTIKKYCVAKACYKNNFILFITFCIYFIR